jgi:hypothetical protein
VLTIATVEKDALKPFTDSIISQRLADQEVTSSKNRQLVHCNEKQLEVGAILAKSVIL